MAGNPVRSLAMLRVLSIIFVVAGALAALIGLVVLFQAGPSWPGQPWNVLTLVGGANLLEGGLVCALLGLLGYAVHDLQENVAHVRAQAELGFREVQREIRLNAALSELAGERERLVAAHGPDLAQRLMTRMAEDRAAGRRASEAEALAAVQAGMRRRHV